MIESCIRHAEQPCTETDFWSTIYSGRSIAILNHYGRLHVYLDHILQHNVVFTERRHALAWLIQKIEKTGVDLKAKLV